jgi:hypothetical protein
MNAINGIVGPPQRGKRLIFGCFSQHPAAQSTSIDSHQ